MADERRFRVEVSLDAGAPEATRAFLRESGFDSLALDRFEALVSQPEKVAIVARLMREHGSAIADLSVYHVEGVVLTAEGAAEDDERPRLKVV